MTPLLARTRVVLVAPTLPENVGSVARAMGHFGLARLVVVAGVDPSQARARTLAAGHDAVLEGATTAATLEEALAGCVLVVGTTARVQAGIDRKAVLPSVGATIAQGHAGSGDIALLFGNERTGLSNTDLRRCHQLITIPGVPQACLNLAQAAAIVCGAWREASEAPGLPTTALAADEGVLDLAGAIAESLDQAGILKPLDRDAKLHTLRRVLSRAALTVDEAALFRGWLAAWTRRVP